MIRNLVKHTPHSIWLHGRRVAIFPASDVTTASRDYTLHIQLISVVQKGHFRLQSSSKLHESCHNALDNREVCKEVLENTITLITI
jgi:hypothetical protein